MPDWPAAIAQLAAEAAAEAAADPDQRSAIAASLLAVVRQEGVPERQCAAYLVWLANRTRETRQAQRPIRVPAAYYRTALRDGWDCPAWCWRYADQLAAELTPQEELECQAATTADVPPEDPGWIDVSALPGRPGSAEWLAALGDQMRQGLPSDPCTQRPAGPKR